MELKSASSPFRWIEFHKAASFGANRGKYLMQMTFDPVGVGRGSFCDKNLWRFRFFRQLPLMNLGAFFAIAGAVAGFIIYFIVVVSIRRKRKRIRARAEDIAKYRS